MADGKAAWWNFAIRALTVAVLVQVLPAYGQQEAFPAPQPLTVQMDDENGVDATSGLIHFRIPDVTIADFAHVKTVLSYDSTTQAQPNPASPPERDSFIGGLAYFDARETYPGAWYPRPSYQIKVGGLAGTFFINADRSIESFDGNVLSGTGVTTWVTPGSGRDYPQVAGANLGIWTFTSRDGTQVEIDTGKKVVIGYSGYIGVATKITYPTGHIIRINYRSDCTTSARIQSVTRNDGLMLKYLYDSSSCAAKHTGVIAINTAYEYCDPFADTCSVDPKWRRSQYGSSVVGGATVYDVTDQTGVYSRFTLDKWGRVAAYRPAGATQDAMSFTYCLSYLTQTNPGYNGNQPTFVPGSADPDEVFCGELLHANSGGVPSEWAYIHNRLRSVTRSGLTWSYGLPTKLAPAGSPYPRQYTIQRPSGPNILVNLDTSPGGGLTNFIDPTKAIVNYNNSESQRITSGQSRGNPNMTFSYDARGNVTENGITSASYDSTCANIVKCNKPNAVSDAPLMAGNQASFAYDNVHGGVLTKTLPAVGGVQPQTRYTYVQRYAWFLNASSVMTRSTEPIWLLASESYCKTGAASGAGCAVSGDEVLTTYDYGPDSGPNNLWPRGKVVTADGTSLRSCYRYSKFGDKISETTPRAGLTVCP